MKKIAISLSALLVAGTAAGMAIAADPDNGEELYHTTEFSTTINGEAMEDIQCSTCHEPDFYTREDRQAKTYSNVSYWVGACNQNLDVGWFPDEVDDVVAYLNRTYYQFPKE